MNKINEEFVHICIGVIVFLTLFASWFNHLYVCFTDEAWGFLIAGAVLFPIAIIHGFGNFVGVW